MISEGSCDTKDWSNDAENSALNKLHFNIYFSLYSHRKKTSDLINPEETSEEEKEEKKKKNICIKILIPNFLLVV